MGLMVIAAPPVPTGGISSYIVIHVNENAKVL